MKTFYKLLAYTLTVATTNNFIWFALTFWIYLETKSVISTGLVGGIYLVAAASSGLWFGAIVDNHRKKFAMLGSSISSLLFYTASLLLFISTPQENFASVTSPALWLFSLLLLAGVIAGNIVNISIPTLVTRLVEADRRDRANGMFGTVVGISFAVTSIASGLVLGNFGMLWVLICAITITLIAITTISLISIPEKKIIHLEDGSSKKIDLKGTFRIVQGIPGLFALIFFTTFNNFLGGVFMALMDAYGLSLMSVQNWGFLLGALSFGFIIGGLFIAKRGLGTNPLRTLFRVNIVTWITCILFTIQPSIILLAIGMLIWLILSPFIEATEQTIIQKVVPHERQGRVFGFAQSLEQAASPLTAFMIGPITQLIFIPFMTTGGGVDLIGNWFGVGTGRGIALVFISAGAIGLVVTLFAMRSHAYKLLAQKYSE